MQAKGGIQSLHKTKDLGKNIIDEAMVEKQQNRTRETKAVSQKQSWNQVVDGPVGQLGTTAVREREGRGERGALIWVLIWESNYVQNKKRSPLSFSLSSNKTENGNGRDLRDSRWTGKGLIVEVAENGKRQVSWDNSKGGRSSFKWAIRADTKHKEKVGISLGLKQLVAHYISNLSPMITSLCNLEARECSNTFLVPFLSTSTPDGFGEKPMVSPTRLVMPVKLTRSDIEGSLSVTQSQVASSVRAM